MTERVAERIEVDDELVLRRWRLDDAEVLASVVYGSLDHLVPWMPWAVDGYDRARAAEFIARQDANWTADTEYSYAIIAGDVVSGSCGLMRRIGPGGLEIGYWVAKDATRRGLATRAAAALTEQAFGLPDIDHVEIQHDELNHASAGIPARLGFTRVGTEPSAMPAPLGSGVSVIWRLARPASD